jgi:hypothetical protein
MLGRGEVFALRGMDTGVGDHKDRPYTGLMRLQTALEKEFSSVRQFTKI